MYYEYFGLKQAPFKITPDTSLFFPGGNRGAVLEALIYAITEGEGIVKVVGEVGAGKTMLCRMLQVELPDKVEVVYLANPSLSPENILHAIAFELNLKVTETDNRLKVMNELQNYLLDRHADNRQIVVFVEEAQGMPNATLEEIRLLSNLETTQNKLLQIVLFGQPELDEKIASKEIRQLKERITYSFKLAPFKKDDVKDYLNSRMRTCGYRSEDVFSSSAISSISKYSKGLLRRINILADKALLAAYAGNTHKVSSNHVEIAARDSEFIKNKLFLSPVMISLAVFIFIVLFGGIVFQENISQRIHSIQESFDANLEPPQGLLSPEQLNENISTTDESIALNKPGEDQPGEDQFETMYIPQAGEDQHIYGVAEKGTQPLDADIPDKEVLELSKFILDNQIRSISDLKMMIENSAETIYLPENQEVPLSPSEPVALGLTEEEFDLFKQQLVVIPPEVDLAGLSGGGEVCENCASIIYRPIL